MVNAAHKDQRDKYPGKSPKRSYPSIDNLVVRESSPGVPMEFDAPATPQSIAAKGEERMTSAFIAGLREVFGPMVDVLLQKQKAEQKQPAKG